MSTTEPGVDDRHRPPPASADGELVARRGDLPGLPAQLRRRQRRRHRRPRRRPGPPRRTCATSASTPSGSPPGTRRRWPTAATTSPTTAPSTRSSATSPRPRALIAEAHELGIRTIIDIVPNHVLRRRTPGSSRRSRPARARPSGSCSGSATAAASTATLPPNHWESVFGGPAWTRVTSADGEPEQWYLHLFAPEPARPQLGAPRRPRASTRTSCGSGSTAAWPASGSTRPRWCAKDPDLPEVTPRHEPGDHPYVDRDELHEIYRSLAARSPTPTAPTAVLVGEVWLPDAERFARYLRPDELHTAFNFDFLAAPGTPPRCATPIDAHPRRRTRRSARRPPGCCPTTTSPGR